MIVYRLFVVSSVVCGLLCLIIGLVIIKVNIVLMVLQVRIKLISFGDGILVCCEFRVMMVVQIVLEKKFRVRIDYVICVGVLVLKMYIRIVVRLVSMVRMSCKLKK